MTILQAVVLGIVQGLTEFLPISSQAHLFLVPYFFGWDYQGLGFDVALHWGTLLAVLLVFGKDYWRYLKALVRPLLQSLPSPGEGGGKEALSPGDLPVRQAGGERGREVERRMARFLVLGSIPAAVFGFLLQAQAETTFRNPLIMVFTLAGFAFLLWWADRRISPLTFNPLPPRGEEGLTNLNWKKVLFIGFAQAIAIIPGVSRSGVTMTAGLFSRLNRESAARFSFLLSGPIIFGAGLVTLQDFVSFTIPLAFGFVAAAVSGFVAIKFLLKYLVAHGFSLFVWYRYILAAVVLASLWFF